MGQPVPAVLDELGLGDRRPGRHHHQGLHGLAPLVVGHADDGDLGDERVGVDDVLELAGAVRDRREAA